MKTKAEIEKEIGDFLAKEAELLGGRKPPWVPVDSQSLTTSHQVNNEAFSGGGHKSVSNTREALPQELIEKPASVTASNSSSMLHNSSQCLVVSAP